MEIVRGQAQSRSQQKFSTKNKCLIQTLDNQCDQMQSILQLIRKLIIRRAECKSKFLVLFMLMYMAK